MIENNHVLIFNWLFDVSSSRPPLPPRFHRDLVASLNQGVAETADGAMRAHVRHGLNDVVRIIGPRAGDAKFERVKSISSRA
jgi:DNA-binding GntR family transcriptional regulator